MRVSAVLVLERRDKRLSHFVRIKKKIIAMLVVVKD